MFRDIREYMLLSQRELSERTGIARSTIAAIETNNLKVSTNVEAKLAQVFEVNDDFIAYQERKRNLEKLMQG